MRTGQLTCYNTGQITCFQHDSTAGVDGVYTLDIQSMPEQIDGVTAMAEQAKLEFEGKVQSWGNSLGLRINRAVSELAGLRKGTMVSIGVTEDAVVIRKKPPEQIAGRRYTEAELLKGMTPHTAHADEVPDLLPGETGT